MTINRAPPGQRLRPDLETTLSGSRVMIDVPVSFDTPMLIGLVDIISSNSIPDRSLLVLF